MNSTILEQIKTVQQNKFSFTIDILTKSLSDNKLKLPESVMLFYLNEAKNKYPELNTEIINSEINRLKEVIDTQNKTKPVIKEKEFVKLSKSTMDTLFPCSIETLMDKVKRNQVTFNTKYLTYNNDSDSIKEFIIDFLHELKRCVEEKISMQKTNSGFFGEFVEKMNSKYNDITKIHVSDNGLLFVPILLLSEMQNMIYSDITGLRYLIKYSGNNTFDFVNSIYFKNQIMDGPADIIPDDDNILKPHAGILNLTDSRVIVANFFKDVDSGKLVCSNLLNYDKHKLNTYIGISNLTELYAENGFAFGLSSGAGYIYMSSNRSTVICLSEELSGDSRLLVNSGFGDYYYIGKVDFEMRRWMACDNNTYLTVERDHWNDDELILDFDTKKFGNKLKFTTYLYNDKDDNIDFIKSNTLFYMTLI